MATMLVINMNIVGVLLGFALPKAFISPNYYKRDHHTPAQIEHYKEEVFWLCAV